MKNQFLMVILLLISFGLQAQTPQRINYQAVARDAAGKPLTNKSIKLKLSILNSSGSGAVQYAETHSVTTNEFGHFAVLIGGGTISTGTMAAIKWDVSSKFLKVEFDPNGGTTYTNMGSVQLVSSPYALMSEKANSVTTSFQLPASQISGAGASSGDVLSWDGTTWKPTAPSGGGAGDNWGTQSVSVSTNFSGNGTTASPLRLAQQGASNGQILKWNGTNWIPRNDSTGADNWGSQVASTLPTISGDGSSTKPLTIAAQGANTGQVLKFNGTTWLPANDSLGSDNWGTQTVNVSTTLTGNGTTANPLSIAQQAAVTGQVLKWSGSTWLPMNDSVGADNWGSQTVNVSATLTGNGTSSSPLALSQLGASSGQVLTWNGTNWAPTTPVGDNWGTQSAAVAVNITGNGTAASPLKLAQQGATSGQFLQWNGTDWVPVTASVGGDNWGTQSAVVTSNLAGNGTTSSPLKIAQQGATSGQILQWNGTDWVPATTTTGGDNWGTQTASVNTTMAGNGTAANPIRIAQQGATTGQFLQWNGTTWAPVSLSGDNWGTQSVVTNATMIGNGTTPSPIGLAPQGASSGQVLKFNGSTWVPSNDSAGGTYSANNGIAISGSTIQLGGALTGPTVITTTASNNLALSGLISGFNSDSIVTINATNNILNRMSRNRLNHWSRDANSNLSYNLGKVSIGTDTSNTKLFVDHVSTTLDTSVFYRTVTSSPLGSFGLVSTSNSIAANSSVAGRFTANGAGIVSIGAQTIATNTGGITGVSAAARSTFNNTRLTGVQGEADSTTNLSFGVYGQGHNFGVAGLGDFTSTKFFTTIAANFAAKYGVLGLNTGFSPHINLMAVGASGQSEVVGVASNVGVLATSRSQVGVEESVGVFTRCLGGDTTQIGHLVFLDSVRNNQVDRFSGVFIGGNFFTNSPTLINADLNIGGTLTKAAGTFKIDHPQDPENKFLIHSFVESPDMMNVYNGNITTDANGFATVTLPDYFSTLNKDFRYQLTAIGSFSSVMVKEKISSNNSFVIQSKESNIEISWQVTGIRKDPYAEKHRIKDVVEKIGAEKGNYIHPELYNQPLEKGLYKGPRIPGSKLKRDVSSNQVIIK